jgi:thioredoxin reductase
MFKTGSPAATCTGRMWILPVETTNNEDGTIKDLTWKIWIISTRLDYLDGLAEDKNLLFAPCQWDSHSRTLEIDVFILGGGNAAAALAARLKALGVSNIMADRNADVGDNWALRYDSLKFHVPTSYCGLPYMNYPPELQDKVLRRDDLAAHLKKYVQTFGLDVINSVEIIRTTLEEDGRWTVKFRTPEGDYTVVAKHLVQATGIGSQKPYTPSILQPDVNGGIAMHSSQYKNTASLKNQGVKSVCIVGSASTAFDVLEDCYNAGLQVTMIVRSPQYLVPLEYICHELGLGSYSLDVEASDNMFMMTPMIVDSQLGQGLFAQLASQEPDRYSVLRDTGFPVIDSRDPDAALMHNLIERGGGHYVDTGATKLLAEGKVGFRAGVEPKSYTKAGLRLSDDTHLDTDAVIWCTGYTDKDARETVADIMKVPLPVDATWGIDEEGEIRGMWKRHSKVDNYWFMGGFTQQHRWYSRTLAQQIKASLEGVLPPPYLDLQD